ncbi:hypothetical protein SAMN05518854_1158 [Variovorax sp. YR266]|uniref:hypothetical protein n=1 Tax=Variovorax sp. YR266 TaxID=1884386 RepID=UPI000896457F|nr:hypothetical protein [Variovorax sp. YR266]SDZ70650.1 hypothetical protein SAMN05518854_1158 [Variovorax sp. YR266]
MENLLTVMTNFYQRIRPYIPWGLSLKLVLSAVVGVLGGAGLLGFASEFATYNYAIYYGFRPPLEGIPYLKAAVTFGSLFLLLTGAVVFATWIFLTQLYAWWLELIFNLVDRTVGRALRKKTLIRDSSFKTFLQRHRARSWWQLLLYSFSVAVCGYITIVITLPWMHRLLPTPASVIHAIASALSFLVFVVLVAIWKRRGFWWVASVVTALYFSAWLVLLFSPHAYASFLRLVSYGGGISITVQVKNETSASRTSAATTDELRSREYLLILRTTEALILFDKGNTTFVEIPREQLEKITSAPGGVRAMRWPNPLQRSD